MKKTVLTLACALLAACGSSDTAVISAPAHVGAGRFTLLTANGQQLPTTVAGKTLLSGFLQLDSSGTYTRDQETDSKNAQGGTDHLQTQDHGTWTSAGDSIAFTTSFSQFGFVNTRGVFTSSGAVVNVSSDELRYVRTP